MSDNNNNNNNNNNAMNFRHRGIKITFEEIVQKCSTVAYRNRFYTKFNRYDTVVSTIQTFQPNKTTEEIQHEIERYAEGTRPILHHKVLQLIDDFIEYVRKYGRKDEQKIYEDMNKKKFISRILQKRPLVFFTPIDDYLLRDGQTSGSGWNNPVMKEYLSYDEIAIGALVGVSVPTFFINNGARANRGLKMNGKDFEHSGIYTALVGARFELPDQMESKFLLVQKELNERSNGYGKEVEGELISEEVEKKRELLKLWAKFYEIDHFPTFDELHNNNEAIEKYKAIDVRGTYFFNDLYKTRMKCAIEPFLQDANDRAKESGKKAHLRVIGLGLGCWMFSQKQEPILIQAYEDVLLSFSFPHISNIEFVWFNEHDKIGRIKTGENGHIDIQSTKSNPANPINSDNHLLVAMYAWDGNSYPGNEYWLESLTASGDPAAACCSLIPFLQNPDINPNVSGDSAIYWDENSLPHSL